MTRHFSLGLQNSEYPRMFQVTGANQNVRKLLSTDLVNTNNNYYCYYCIGKMFFYGGFGTTWEYLLQYFKELNRSHHYLNV